MEPIGAARRLFVAATAVVALSTLGSAVLVLVAVHHIAATTGDHTTDFSTIGGIVGGWLVTLVFCFAAQALAAHVADHAHVDDD